MPAVPGLIYVPILHTQREAAAIAVSLKSSAHDDKGDVPPGEHHQAIADMWGGIAKKIAQTNIPCRSFRIYQDSLPVCGIERRIVEQLAEKDGLNHRLILELLDKGARLEGTEDPDLLVEEYDALNEFLRNPDPKARQATLEKYCAKSDKVMEKRDAFIAERIRRTIQPGETPLVFMGVRHRLEKLLKPHFIVAYIIYRLPFKKVGDIYNA